MTNIRRALVSAMHPFDMLDIVKSFALERGYKTRSYTNVISFGLADAFGNYPTEFVAKIYQGKRYVGQFSAISPALAGSSGNREHVGNAKTFSIRRDYLGDIIGRNHDELQDMANGLGAKLNERFKMEPY